MKESVSFSGKKIRACLAIIIILLAVSGTRAFAQAQTAVINPDGGVTLTDGLRITVTDSSILVKRHNQDQYNMSGTYPGEDHGLRTYVILEQKFGAIFEKDPKYLKACSISGVHGSGTSADPWKVVVMSSVQNLNSATFNISTVISYVAGNSYYLIDYFVSANEQALFGNTGGIYYVHFYLSEHTWMDGTDCAKGYSSQPVSTAGEPYHDFINAGVSTIPRVVGTLRESGDCAGSYTGGHFFRTEEGFTSFFAGAFAGRDDKISPFYRLKSQINNTPQSAGVAVHKAIEVLPVNNYGSLWHETKRIAVGFDKNEMEALTLSDPPLALDGVGYYNPVDSSQATIEFSASTATAPEGEDTLGIQGVTLNVKNGWFNLPQIANLRVTTTGTGAGHAAPGTDYQVTYTSVIIPPGYYGLLPINLDNILINGNSAPDGDRTMLIELLPDCSPFLKLGTVASCLYTIQDDDDNQIELEAEHPVLSEGETMKIKVKLTGAPLATDLTVNLAKGAGDAESEDHSALPSSVVIPAGQHEVAFDLTAVGDRILEPAEESFDIEASAVINAVNKNAVVLVKIADTTGANAANKVLSFSAAPVLEGQTAILKASLPEDVTTELPLSVDITPDWGTSSAMTIDLDNAFPATVTIPAWGADIDFTVDAADDNYIEETEHVLLNGSATGFTVQAGSLEITDSAPKDITMEFRYDVTALEGYTYVSCFVVLPPGYMAGYDFDVNVFHDPASEADGNDHTALGGTVHFGVGDTEQEIVIDINNDDVLEPDEALMVSGSAPGFTVTPGTVTLLDATGLISGNRSFTLETDFTTIQEGGNITITAKLPPGLTAGAPITIHLLKDAAGSSAEMLAADYDLPSSIVILPGENAHSVTLQAKSDDVIEATEILNLFAEADIFGEYTSLYQQIDITDETGTAANRQISVNAAPHSVTEGNSYALVFSLPPGITASEDIDIAITNTGTAVDADLTAAIPAVLTIPANTNSVTWTIAPISEGDVEGTETLLINGIATDYTVNGGVDITIDILDTGGPANTIDLTATQTHLQEGNAFTITAALQAGTAASNIAITLSRGGTSEATDHTTLTTITIPAGAPSVTFTVDALPDNILEADETLVLNGVSAGYTINGITLDIEDGTSGHTITVMPDVSILPEGTTTTVWVSLPTGITTEDPILVQLDRGTGASIDLLATEYTFPASVMIPANGDKVSFTLEAYTDNLIEPLEMLEIAAEADIYGTTATDLATVNILDDNDKTITVTGPPTVNEGNAAIYTFSLPPGITSSSDITISLTNGTSAATDADFTATIPSTITIPAHQNSISLTFSAITEGVIESPESLELIPAATGFTLNGRVQLSVLDGDASAASIQLSGTNVTEGGNATITAILQGGVTSGSPIAITLSRNVVSSSSPGDISALPVITIPAGQTSASTTISALNDHILETTESLLIDGSALGYTIIGGSLNITDATGAVAANKIVTITPANTSVAEGTSATVEVSLPVGITTELPLNVQLVAGPGTSAGLDASEYAFPATVTIPAHGNSISFTMQAQTDFVIEPVETLEIAAEADVYGTIKTAACSISITDDRTITITGPASVTEGGAAVFTFSLPTGMSTAMDIVVNLVMGTSTASAADFASIPATVTILSGSSSGTLTLNALTDHVIEPTEQLKLIPVISGFTTIGNVALDVLDGDGVSASIALTGTGGAEGGQMNITATLQGGITSGTDITVHLTKQGVSTASNADHDVLPSIIIPAGQSSGTSTVTASLDNILEPMESLVLTGSSTGFTVTGTSVNITDATAGYTLTVTPDIISLAEGTTTAVWVSLPPGITTAAPITVQLQAGAATMLAAGEYNFPASVNIPANGDKVSFTLQAYTDNIIEPTEMLVMAAEADINGTIVSASGNVNITDNNVKTIAIAGPSGVTEGGDAIFTFSLPSGVTTSSAIPISLTVQSSTATAADFTTLPASIIIPANSNSVTLTLHAASDNVLEGTEHLSLTPAVSNFTFTGSVSLDITDDIVTPTIVLTGMDAQEGSDLHITATLQGGLTSSSDITLVLAKDAISSTAVGTDHGIFTSIIIPAGQSSATIDISAATDDLMEWTETLKLEGTASGFTVTGTTVNIEDGNSRTFIVDPAAASVTEGHLIKVWIRLASSQRTQEPLTIQLAPGSSTAATLQASEYILPSTVTIPAGASEVSFDLIVNTDHEIEPAEILEIAASANVYGTPYTTTEQVSVTDDNDKTLTITGPGSVMEGDQVTLTFSLAPGVTSVSDITVNFTAGTSTAIAADFTGLPTSITIPAGQSSATLTLEAVIDHIIESTEHLQMVPSASGYSLSGNIELDLVNNDATGAAIALSGSAVTEGQTTTVTATLQGGITSASPVTVTLTKDGVSTAADTDHDILPVIVIPAGQTSGSVIIAAATDDIIETTETLILQGTAPGYSVLGTIIPLQDAATGRTITLTPDHHAIGEGSSTVVWVSLPAGITTAAPVNVQLQVAAGTQLATGEYHFPASIIIPANANNISFTVSADTDDVIEPTELLKIDASADISGTPATANTAINITDATSKLIGITGPASIQEGSDATFTVSLPAGVTSLTDIVVLLTPGASTAGTEDLTSLPANVVIPANTGSISFTLEAVTDNILEPTEHLQLLPAATGFTFNGQVALDIVDEHSSSTITISSDKAAITEDGSAATITVSLPGTLTAGSDITVMIQKGASSTADIADHSIVPASVIIPSGHHSTSFNVTAPADAVIEQIETLVLEGTATSFSVLSVSVDINDATAADPANTRITLVPVNALVTEDASVSFQAKLPAGIISTVPIVISLEKLTASTAGSADHSALPATVTIPAMSNSSPAFTITVPPDQIIESNESLQIGGTPPAGFTLDGTVITIKDATSMVTANRIITITVDSTTLHEGNSSKITFALPTGVVTEQAITIAVMADGSLTAGSTDYKLVPATVVISPMENKTEIMLEVLHDNLAEATEQLRLSAMLSGYIVQPSGIIEIPGEPVPAVTLNVVKTKDAVEPGTNGSFTIQLAGGATAPEHITVSYSMAGTALDGIDCQALAGQAIISKGKNSVDIPVNILDDYIVEGEEVLEMTLTAGTFDFISQHINCSVSTAAASMRITDDDQPTLLIEKVKDAQEPDMEGRFRVRFAQDGLTSVVPLSVAYTTGGTAIGGLDYTALSGTVNIPAGAHESIITVTPADNHLLELPKTVIVKLTSATAALPGVNFPIDAQDEASIAIQDDEMIEVEVLDAGEVTEGGILTVKLRASEAAPYDVAVKISVQHDNIRSVLPAGTTHTVIIPAHQLEADFEIAVTDNETNDDNGFIQLTVEPYNGTGQPYSKGTGSSARMVIKDNDPLEITLKPDTVKVTEGLEPLRFKVELNRASTREIKVQYLFTDPFEGFGAEKDMFRAQAGRDFDNSATSITIPPMQLEAMLEVPVTADPDWEWDEYLNLRLGEIIVVSGQNMPMFGGMYQATGVILNDDIDTDREVHPSRGLSPNGDGKHDVWLIQNIEKYPRNEVVLMNRWGGVVFKTKNYNNYTNYFKGRANTGSGIATYLPDGSYFYVLQVWDENGVMTRHTGYIVMKRG